jgi:hypothetical protein
MGKAENIVFIIVTGISIFMLLSFGCFIYIEENDKHKTQEMLARVFGKHHEYSKKDLKELKEKATQLDSLMNKGNKNAVDSILLNEITNYARPK